MIGGRRGHRLHIYNRFTASFLMCGQTGGGAASGEGGVVGNLQS